MSKNELIDTHSHIHFPNYGLDPEEVWQESVEKGVTGMIVVGCRLEDSQGAIKFAAKHDNVWAAVGLHPHEAGEILAIPSAKIAFEALLSNPAEDKVVAIGECGLDYYYENASKESQKELLHYQLKLASEHDLPVIFHVRDAFNDFWPIYDQHKIKNGVVHSFTGVKKDVEEALRRNLYIGLNGIVTFSKSEEQLNAIKDIPLESVVVETDAPYLTPKPFRGKICKPEHVELTAKFLAEHRGEPFELFASSTTDNARRLFNVSKTE